MSSSSVVESARRLVHVHAKALERERVEVEALPLVVARPSRQAEEKRAGERHPVVVNARAIPEAHLDETRMVGAVGLELVALQRLDDPHVVERSRMSSPQQTLQMIWQRGGEVLQQEGAHVRLRKVGQVFGEELVVARLPLSFGRHVQGRVVGRLVVYVTCVFIVAARRGGAIALCARQHHLTHELADLLDGVLTRERMECATKGVLAIVELAEHDLVGKAVDEVARRHRGRGRVVFAVAHGFAHLCLKL